MSSGVSPNFETELPGSIADEYLSVALIGTDQVKRRALAIALAESRRTKVREFLSYPAGPGDLGKLLEQHFDVIVLDLDSDPDLALQLVETIIADETAIVMVYSERGDQNLVLRCMHAGAREYLLLPLDQDILAQALVRAANILRPRTRHTKKTLGRLHVFLGAKGGSGVTTISCNLAIVLAQESDQSTLLIDMALPIGDAALSLGLAAEHSTDDALRNADRLDSSFLQKLLVKHRSGAFLLAAPSKVPEVEGSKEAIDKLMAIARREFDHVIVDVGSRVDLVGTALFKEASTVYMVTQAGISELRNANRLISQFFNNSTPKLEVVVNRFESRLLGGLNEDLISKALGRPVRWKIPDDQDGARRLQYNDDGLSSAETRISRLSLEMACSIVGRPVPQEKKKGLGLKGFGRSIMEKASKADDPPGITVASTGATRIEPTIAWSAPDPIIFGDALTIAQLNANASVPGALVYTPGPGYVLPVGTHTLWVTLTPADSAENAPIQAAVTIVVSKARPAISWPAPLAMVYGAPLSTAQLNASGSVRGRFEYSPGLGEVLPAGIHTLSATFTPENEANYATERSSVTVTVAKATPTIEWATPEPITCETPLGAAQLNASVSVPGVLDYSPEIGNLLQAGTHTITVVFTPTDQTNFTTAQAVVSLSVHKATPLIDWSIPHELAYGTLLSATQLSATASVPGTFDYNPGLGALLAVGEHTLSVVFTPTDALNYSSAEAAVSLAVTQAIPTIAWSNPGPISFGCALNAVQLNASATVAGSFAYTPAAGQILAPGVHTLSVTFTPTDTLDYTQAQAAVSLTVADKSPVCITWPPPSAICYGTPLSAIQLNAAASVEGTFAYTPAGGHVLAPGSYVLCAYFTPADTEKYATAQATVELEVQVSSRVTSSPALNALLPSVETIPDCESAFAISLENDAATGHFVAPANQPERRVYKGAVYEKGDDRQWHLQQM